MRDIFEELDNKIPGDGLDVLLPPRNATDDITDEDSANEDCPNVNNLPRSQLMEPLVIQSTRSRQSLFSSLSRQSLSVQTFDARTQTYKSIRDLPPPPARISKQKVAWKERN